MTAFGPPPIDNDDPRVDTDNVRLHAWWKAEFDQLIAHGFDPFDVAHSAMVAGFCRLAEVAGSDEARRCAEPLARP